MVVKSVFSFSFSVLLNPRSPTQVNCRVSQSISFSPVTVGFDCVRSRMSSVSTKSAKKRERQQRAEARKNGEGVGTAENKGAGAAGTGSGGGSALGVGGSGGHGDEEKKRRSDLGSEDGSGEESGGESENEDGGDDDQDQVGQLLAQMEAMQTTIARLEREKVRRRKRELFPGPTIQVPTSGGMRSSAKVPGSGSGASAFGAGAGAAPATFPKLPDLAKMSQFGGEMDADGVDGWIRELVIQTTYYEATGAMMNEQLKVLFASSHLKGAASDWWFSGGKGAVTTLAEFIDAVNGRFKSSLDADMASDKLAVLKQGTHQPVTQYVGQVQQLLIKIPDMDMGSRVRGFIRGLLPHLAQKLREGRPKTASEAYEMAIRMEGSFGTKSGMGKIQANNNVETEEEQGNSGGGGMQPTVTLAAVQRIVEQSLKNRGGGGGNYQGPNDGPSCFRCGRRGHMVSECKATERLCYRCKKPGHIKADCPNKTKGGAGGPGGQVQEKEEK